MFGWSLRSAVEKAVKQAFEDATNQAVLSLNKSRTLSELEKKIADMEVAQSRKQEEWDKREREVEHKIGLERKRQEVETAQAAREATLSVREENLKADRERFKAEMDFQRKRLEEEVGALRELVQKMLERLPSAEIYADMSKKR